MKKVILFSIAFLIGLLCFSQHTMYLKSGEKLKGKLIGFKKDSISYLFMGNKLRVAQKDVIAVYFNDSIEIPQIANNKPTTQPTASAQVMTQQAETTVPKPAIVEQAKPAAEQKPGKIIGAITYYIIKKNITKPDSASRIYLIDSTKVPKFDITVVDTFYFGNAYREIYDQYKTSHTKMPNDIPQQLILWKANDKNSFDMLSRRAFKNVSMLKNTTNKIKTMADENGKFSFTVKPGTYYLYIVSNYVQGETVVDLEGKTYCKKVVVKSDDEVFVKNNFDVFQ